MLDKFDYILEKSHTCIHDPNGIVVFENVLKFNENLKRSFPEHIQQ